MYLEISPRRTGKCRRLAKAIIKTVEEGHNAVVFFPNVRMARYFKQKYLQDLPNNLWTPIEDMEQYNLWLKVHGDRHPRIFVDEFDYVEEFPLSDDGYYSTTPRFMRTEDDMEYGYLSDALVRLLSMNHGTYTTMAPTRQNNSTTLPEFIYQIEVLGRAFD